MENHTQEKKLKSSVLRPDGVRQAIGYLGIFMPAMLLLGTFIIGKCPEMQDSISHYYFTIMGNALVATLCGFAVFLFIYQGYDTWDNIVTSFAAVCALGIALFATSQIDDIDCSVVCLKDYKPRIIIHYISATLFFITLSYISAFLFTKSTGEKTIWKKRRNRVYRICAGVMMVSILMVLLIKLIPDLKDLLANYKPVFWLEWIALIAFGISWLVKGKTFMQDSK